MSDDRYSTSVRIFTFHEDNSVFMAPAYIHIEHGSYNELVSRVRLESFIRPTWRPRGYYISSIFIQFPDRPRNEMLTPETYATYMRSDDAPRLHAMFRKPRRVPLKEWNHQPRGAA